MSSRVLRKLQSEKEKDLADADTISDIELEFLGGAKKKQLNLNRYDLLNQQSHSESEVKEDDNETEAPLIDSIDSMKKRRKKRKKKSTKTTHNHRSSEDNADADEVERSLREVNRLLGENTLVSAPSQKAFGRTAVKKTILSVQHKNLNPSNELKRMFGSKVIQEPKRKSRAISKGHAKTTWLVTVRDNWPQVGKSGLSMSLLKNEDGVQCFTYEHSQKYRDVENTFLQAVETFHPDNLVLIINEHPYHVNALLQMSDICKLSEDFATAAELVERALYHLECAFHPLFNIAQGNCRLDYRRQENRALFVTIFKHLTFLGGRACCRTSMELCKLLLSLDPDSDPVAIKLSIDFYALRAKEYQWLVDFVLELNDRFYLLQLPNYSFSMAIAYFYLGDSTKADVQLQDALLMFPFVLLPLLEKCSIQIDARVLNHAFFVEATEKTAPSALIPLIKLYVKRNYHIWRDADLLPWLEKNVHEVLDRVDEKQPIVEDYKEKRTRRFSGILPLSIARHIVLSDELANIPLPEALGDQGVIMNFDPFPPKDGINLYSRPKRPTVASTSSNPFMMFVNSLIPDYNPNRRVDVVEGVVAEGQLDQAQLAAGNADFRGRIASLVDAINVFLSELRPEEQQQQNDADDDAEEDVSADDDLS